jgi:hypothetical protein
MKQFLPILVLVCSTCSYGWELPQNAATQVSAQSSPGPTSSTPATPAPVDKAALDNSHKAKALIDQAIQALGGQAYLTIRDFEQQGRGYSFHHGRPGGGDVFWSFTEFPDKERVEYTKERDIARVFVADKGYEITYKGPHPVEAKDLVDYLRQRQYSLATVLRTWVNDPSVILLYEGSAVAAQHSAEQVTLINSKNESVTLDFDIDNHLPIRKAFEWRDPIDKQKNLEEEIYDNYRLVSGVMIPFNVTRNFNGDMSRQRFLFSATINQGLDEAMFDPNSGYNPNKPAGKQSSKR